MLPDDTRRKIKDITEGAIIKGSQDNCTTIRNFLCAGFPTSTTVKKDFESKAIIKEEQASLLETYSKQNNLWVTADLPAEDRYLTRGGEALVYLDADNKTVIKLNDAVYYATWLEFLIVYCCITWSLKIQLTRYLDLQRKMIRYLRF